MTFPRLLFLKPLSLAVTLLLVTLPAAADSGDEPKAIPLGDVPASESTVSAGPAADATPSADEDDARPAYFADRDNKEGISTVRGTFALGAQLALASDSLEPSTGSAGGGGRLNFGFAPPTWPVLFGASLDLVSYGSSSVTYEDRGVIYEAELEQLSHVGQAFVRLQPEKYTFRPYIDLTGGYWVVIFNQQLENRVDDDAIKTVRAGATGCYGVGVGLDWLFGEWEPWGNYGIGFDVRYTRGISLPVPDLSTASTEDGELHIPGTTKLKAPAQLLFTLSLVVSSENGNWVTSGPQVKTK